MTRLSLALTALICLATPVAAAGLNDGFNLQQVKQFLPALSCDTSSAEYLNAAGEWADLPVDRARCRSEFVDRVDVQGFALISNESETVEEYFGAWMKVGEQLCSLLIPRKPVGTPVDLTGCSFGLPKKSELLFSEIYTLWRNGKIPDSYASGSMCTRLPTVDASLAENAAVFGPILRLLGSGLDWRDIKQRLSQDGFVDGLYDDNSMMRTIGSADWPDDQTGWEIIPFPAFVIYQGKQREGRENHPCHSGIDCDALGLAQERQASEGLCITTESPGP